MTAEPLLDIAIEQHEAWTLVRVAGELDIATAPQLESACDASEGRLALELSQVRFMDSTGLRSLVRLRSMRTGLVLVAPNVSVRRLLALTKLSDEFLVLETVEQLTSQ